MKEIIRYNIYNDITGEYVGIIHLEEGNIHAKNYSNNSPVLFGINGEIENPTERSIMLFLQDRVVPLDRQELPSLIASVGLKEYDLHKLIAINGGRNTDDYFSLKRDYNVR